MKRFAAMGIAAGLFACAAACANTSFTSQTPQTANNVKQPADCNGPHSGCGSGTGTGDQSADLSNGGKNNSVGGNPGTGPGANGGKGGNPGNAGGNGPGNTSGNGTNAGVSTAGGSGGDILGTSASAAAVKPDPSTILVENGGTLVLPGTIAAQVGIDFEDSDKSKNWDSMDVLVCVAGGFKIDGSNFVSYEEQDIQFTTHTVGGPVYGHQMQVTITDPDGTVTPKSYSDADFATPFTMHTKIGSKIEVTMQPISDEGSALRNQHMSCPYVMIHGNYCPPNTGAVPCAQ